MTKKSEEKVRWRDLITDPAQWLAEQQHRLSYIKIFETLIGNCCNYSHSCLCYTSLNECPVFKKLVMEQKIPTEARVKIAYRTERTANCEGCAGEYYDEIEFVLDCDSSKIKTLRSGCSKCRPFRLDKKSLTTDEYHEWLRKNGRLFNSSSKNKPVRYGWKRQMRDQKIAQGRLLDGKIYPEAGGAWSNGKQRG